MSSPLFVLYSMYNRQNWNVRMPTIARTTLSYLFIYLKVFSKYQSKTNLHICLAISYWYIDIFSLSLFWGQEVFLEIGLWAHKLWLHSSSASASDTKRNCRNCCLCCWGSHLNELLIEGTNRGKWSIWLLINLRDLCRVQLSTHLKNFPINENLNFQANLRQIWQIIIECLDFLFSIKK